MIRKVLVALTGIAIVSALLAVPAGADALSITSFSPTIGPPGTTVVITGRGFSSTTDVKFNGVAAQFTVNTAKKMTAKVPPTASSGPISITRSKPAATVSSTTDFTVTLPPDSTPWPTYQANPQRTGKSIGTGPGGTSVHPLWAYKAKSIVRNEPSVAPDGTVYIGESTCPLAALNSFAGTRNFCTTVGGQTAQSTATVGNAFMKTDAQGTRKVQTVYMGDRNNIFWAFDSEGAVLWNYKINLDGDVRASAIIGPDPTDTIYMMCGCTTRGVIHAFSKSGALNWFLNIPGVRDASPAGVQFGAHFRLYVMTNNAELMAIDDMGTSGQVAWSLDLGLNSEHVAPMVGPDGTIYVSSDHALYAVKDNGTTGSIKPAWPFVPAQGDIDTTAAISSGKVYVSSQGPGTTRNLYAVDASNAQQLWTLTGVGGGSASLALTPSAAIGSNGLVYMAIGKDVYAFDPALPNPGSAPRWHFVVGDDVISMAVGDGVLYVSSRDAKVYALVS